MNEKRFSASLVIPAVEPEQVFAVLRDPGRHQEFDATTMVGSAISSEVVERVGQVFSMRMSYHEGNTVEYYSTDNHVTAYHPPRRIAWATATRGGAPLGWTWRYDVEAAAGGTLVRLTYDWSDTTPATMKHYGVPIMDSEDLRDSLRRLAGTLRPAGAPAGPETRGPETPGPQP